MKKIVFALACVFMVAVTFQACKESDQKVQEQVNKVLSGEFKNISASVKDGVVTLTGNVESDAEKMGAQSAVSGVKYVKSVVNNIEVHQPAPVINPDDTLKAGLEAALLAGGYKDVKVEVSNQEVTLSGNLKKSELKKVMQIANDAGPKKVVNKLTLK